MAASIIIPTEFDVSKLSFGAIRKLDSGGKSILISFNGSPLVMQLPEMVAPFGMSVWEGEGRKKYSLDLSFKGREERPILDALFKGLQQFDEVLVKNGLDNSQNWLKKKYTSLDVVKALYSPTIKFPKDENGNFVDTYPPTFKLTLPCVDGRFTFDTYDTNRQLVDIQELHDKGRLKGARISTIAQCTGIWVADKTFGCSWKVVQMQVIPRSSISGFAFRQLEASTAPPQEEVEEDIPEPPVHEEIAAAPADDDIIESDDDDLDAKPGDAIAPAAAAPVTAAKKVVSRAKKT